MSADVGGRGKWAVLGYLTGYVGGATLGVLIALSFSDRWLIGACLGAMVGGAGGHALAFGLTALPGSGRRVAASALKWAGGGYVVGLVLVAALWAAIGATFSREDLLGAAFLLACTTLTAAAIGLTRGMRAASKEEAKVHAAIVQTPAEAAVVRARGESIYLTPRPPLRSGEGETPE